MASLREIKDRIGSVRSTLKITSAMKLVASAKLRKAQRAIEGMRPYERTLGEILASLQYGGISPEPPAALKSLSDFASKVPGPGRSADADFASLELPRGEGLQNHEGPTAVVAIASNSSLCGGFNANVVRKALEAIRGCEGPVEVYPLGRKMAEALRRAGYTADQDYNDLVGHPAYDKSAALARRLAERYERGELSRVVLVYTSFVSASRQEPVAEQYLPFCGGNEILRAAQDDRKGNQDDRRGNQDDRRGNQDDRKGNQDDRKGNQDDRRGNQDGHGVILSESEESDYILEPDAAALVAQLLPQVMMLKFHAAILDSAAAEQAARTLAMQTATDNAEELLGELTLEYNKGRQQKITAEILDLLGGAQ